MENIVKGISEITRKEWIAWRWVDVTEGGESDRMFMRQLRRTPDEAYQAMIEWDETEEARCDGDIDNNTSV